ncbi:conjugal transfer protein TraG N-terminal domain-containing protein [Phocoenobacter skyensis]|uniref:conjugal transfer protein TraG N-terminal domain-containing protein n=1 Tax=Phocoenobacter skyensis TaxID=97481 RepID=UPI002756E470|nr:conjugal transfer protein TraG N-terminal domain-containing protein [Pasteurella skyensis]MDP8185326.1 conjugal transfer protein TraG N-terminal domain-containing protein [Pasteurella skyensis]
MTFTVDSYLEYFLTLLGWIINNGIFGVLVSTGLFLAPLIAKMLGVFLEVKKQGDDEGNKGELLIRWLGLTFIPAMFVVVLVLAPTLTVSLNNIEHDQIKQKECGYHVAKDIKDTGYSHVISSFAGKQAKVPIWWALMHKINKGVTHAAVATIPCTFDLRQMRFEVQSQRIKEPVLLSEVEKFVEQCYVPARTRIYQEQLSLTPAQVRETSWLGGSLLLSESELYPKYHAMQPMKLWPYVYSRDQGLKNTGQGGYPTCKEWWADSNIGLKDRLVSYLKANMSSYEEVKSLFRSEQKTDEVLLKTVLRPENVNVSRGKQYPSYSGSLRNEGDFFSFDTLSKAGSTFGSIIGTVTVSQPGFDAMRQALPMVQSFMIMSIIILMPIIVVLSGYSLKTTVTLTFVYFAVITTTFWWELARWLDSTLIGLLEGADAHSVNYSYVLRTGSDQFILNFVTGSLFLVLPAIWIGAMSWAGVGIGNMAQNFTNASQDAQRAGKIKK